MITFKQMIEESFQYGGSQNRRVDISKAEELEISKISSFHNRFVHQGWNFLPTIHASARAFIRVPEYEAEDWFKLHKNVVAKINSLATTIKAGSYVFYSKSMNQAYVAAVDPDKKLIKIITVLPKGKSSPAGGDQTRGKTVRMIVEGVVVEKIVYID